MRFNRLFRHRRHEIPFRPLVTVVVAALLLGCLPQRASIALKDAGRAVLAPGQQVAQSVLAHVASWFRTWEYRADSAGELRRLQRLVERLNEQNEALRLSLRQQSHEPLAAEQPTSLLGLRAVEARVLGERGQAFLRGAAIMSGQRIPDLMTGSLAVDFAPAVIDQGENVSLAAGDMVLAGGRIWGKLIEVGPQTALVRRIDSVGYRGLVQIGHTADGAWKPLARGILEGTGNRLCRIRLVDATAPVAVGDMVFAAEEQGLIDSALIYGRIERAELAPGAAHWQLWMSPAADSELPTKLTILQPVVNESRKVAGTLGVP
jgi:cell shape-determining protein MreC